MADNLNHHLLCINCMRLRVQGVLCPECGYDERKYKQHPLYLRAKTILKEQYVIGKILGQGGFGVTYLGFDLWLQKKVAIKEYLPAALATRDFSTANIIPIKKQEVAFNQGLDLFINEARHLAKFDHPNIVRVINFFQENQTGYMVMEYLDGDSPLDILNQAGGKLSEMQMLAIIFPLLDALTEIHAHSIYHRDISVQNVRILKTGEPVLIDFGAARHVVGEGSHSLDLVLKHGYSPLEQYSGKGKIGAWTDIYACGALMYLLITGQLPPAATDRYGEDSLIAPKNMQDVEISEITNNVIMRALAVRWEERFQCVTDVKLALQGRQSIDFNSIITTNIPVVKLKSPSYRIAIILLFLSALLLFPWVYEKVVQPTILESDLAHLLNRANMQWSNAKLLSPQGDNVFETYQQILQRAPTHPDALQGLRRLIEHFQRLAEVAYQQKQWGESLRWVQQALQVKPTDLQLLALERKIQLEITQQEILEQKSNRIKELIDKARQYTKNSQLKFAYETYQKILEIDNKHAVAKDEQAKLAELYGQSLQVHKDRDKALISLKEGLGLFPNDSNLQALQKELLQELNQQKQVTELLQKARRQLTTDSLTEGVLDDALIGYQQVLKLTPDNQQAVDGIEQIARSYEKLARQESDLQKKLNLLRKGLALSPRQADLVALQKSVLQQLAKIEQLRELSVEKKELAAEKAVEKVPEQIVEPLVEKSQESSTTIQNLLIIAEKQVNEQKLDAAYQTYRNVLSLEPENRVAKEGLQQLAEKYYQLAKSQCQQGDSQVCLSLVEKGLQSSPNHSELLLLQQDVKRRIAQSEKDKSVKPAQSIILTPSF